MRVMYYLGGKQWNWPLDWGFFVFVIAELYILVSAVKSLWASKPFFYT
jgi:hypothetical protein